MRSKKPTKKIHEGLESRKIAQEILTRVLLLKRPLDEAFDALDQVEPQDRGFVRVLVLETLRRHGSIQHILGHFLEKSLPEGLPRLKITLEMGVTQLLFMDVSPHAALYLSVELVRIDPKARGFDKLINAVLRAISREKEALLADIPPLADMPKWLQISLKPYGEERIAAIAANLRLPDTLDISVKDDAENWAPKLEAELLPQGSLRLAKATRIEELEGFSDGQWIVQNAASSMPVKLMTINKGDKVLDLCAAPGGKTAQLIWTGAEVTALDRSKQRVLRLEENLARLKLSANVIVGDALTFKSDELFDAILLDAPCSATGTLRGNPDIALLKTKEDVKKLADQQLKMIEHAITLLKQGGKLMFCTCSMQREEGEDLLAKIPSSLQFTPLTHPLTTNGYLRLLPDQGYDGFFAAQFTKK